MFYQLLVLNDGGGDLFIPVDKIAAVGIRRLIELAEIPALLDHLTQPASVADNYRQRRLYIMKLFASGSVFDLAEIVGSLTELNKVRPLSFGENKTLEKAKGLLVCEIAEVAAISRDAARAQVEAALETRARKAKGGAATRSMTASRNHPRYQAASG
jgi:RNA polymerase-interacting CarD/CdnL/TRCF family regulator